MAHRFAQVTIAPVELGTIVAVGYAAAMWRRHRGEVETLALAIGGFAWFVVVAAMTQAGFAGNQRYLIVTTAVVCVLGGMGAVRVLQGVEWVAQRWFGPRRAPAITAAALLAGVLAGSPTIVAKANNEARVRGGLEHEAYLWHDLKGLIHEAGGKDELLACGGVYSGPFQTQMVAYELGIHGIQVGWKVTPPPGVLFRTRTVPDGPLVTKPTDDRYRPGRHERQVAAAHRAAGRSHRLSQGEPVLAHLGHRRQRRHQGRAARGDRQPAEAAGIAVNGGATH